MMPKEKPPITVVGDVGGRIAIIVVRKELHQLPCSNLTHVYNPLTFLQLYSQN